MGLTRIERAEFETPWGGGWVWVCDSHPVAIYLPHSEHEDSVSVSEQIASDLEISCGAKGVPVGECAEQWASRLGTFLLTGVPQWDRGDVNLAAIDADGFRGRVYERLMEVPAGETVGYGELAARAGSPRPRRQFPVADSLSRRHLHEPLIYPATKTICIDRRKIHVPSVPLRYTGQQKCPQPTGPLFSALTHRHSLGSA